MTFRCEVRDVRTGRTIVKDELSDLRETNGALARFALPPVNRDTLLMISAARAGELPSMLRHARASGGAGCSRAYPPRQIALAIEMHAQCLAVLENNLVPREDDGYLFRAKCGRYYYDS
jgi:hypothetical protein